MIIAFPTTNRKRGDCHVTEIPGGVLDSKWELHGKPGNRDKNNAYLDYPEQVYHLLKLAIL
jgi:hypothetical protein